VDGATCALLAVALLVGSTLPASIATARQPADPRFFSQTNFRIDNDAFWNFFQGRGGVPTFGFPVSRQFLLDGFQVQIFQRNIMQLQPDGGVQTLNLLDPGLMPYTRINGSTFPAPDPAIVSATPSVSDPNYDSAIITFTQQQAPNTFDGQPVNFYQTFTSTVSWEAAFPNQECQQNLIRCSICKSGRADERTGLRSGESKFHLPALPAQHHALRLHVLVHRGAAAGRLLQVNFDRPELAGGPGPAVARDEVLPPVRSFATALDRPTGGAPEQ
jgi:hypothetical protein